MIELKPYRGTTASHIEKNDKTRLAGETRTGRQAYPWYENRTVMTYAGCFFAILFVMALGVTLITQTPIGLCFGVVIAILAVYVINALWQNYLNQYVGQPTMLVSTEHARRGDSIIVRFRQPVRRNLVIENGKIELLAREWVRYKCGTDTCHETYDHPIQRKLERKQRQISANESYELDLTLTVPPQAMHSFAFADNSLTWIIRVTVVCREFLTLTELYAIQVTPEVHTYD